MKNFDVRYWIKANRTEVEYSMIVFAKDAKEACRICKDRVKRKLWPECVSSGS